MSARIAIAIIAATWLSACPSVAADFTLAEHRAAGEVQGPRILIEMTGPIVEGDADRLESVVNEFSIENRFEVFRSTRLSLDSPGGALDPSIELARRVQSLGLATYIGDGNRCLSGCAIVFMAGRWLDGDNSWERFRVLHPNGELGFHAPFAFANMSDVSAYGSK